MASEDSQKKQSMALPKEGEQGISAVSQGRRSRVSQTAKSAKSRFSIAETSVYGSEKKRRKQGTHNERTREYLGLNKKKKKSKA